MGDRQVHPARRVFLSYLVKRSDEVVAVDALRLAGSLEGSVSELDLSFEELPIGGIALDLVGIPLSEETLIKARSQMLFSSELLDGTNSSFLIFKFLDLTLKWRKCVRPKWDNNPKHLKPITALLQLRTDLEVFSNLRPITVFPQLKMGICNAHPRGFTTNEQGDEVGFCTESYSASEVDHIARVAFDFSLKFI
ncbi:hypothetical protein F2Q69_00040287 [Brassica cretica]|uniref:Isopropylmalate dehydrogenase-like domain-containing protein n=1 Tax=Brassica cretica TaxID=69181 RepID=A0A8S9NKW5_BRACR|nr:hypothetical protein F2Q69_00040287 [Brassica cretica]